MKLLISLILMLCFSLQSLLAKELITKNKSNDQSIFVYGPFSEDTTSKLEKNHPQLFKHQFIEKDLTMTDHLKNVAFIYGLTWVFYPTFQPKVFKLKNGFQTYKNNFGKLVFDKDEPIWNNFVHPISGSQLYLFYRASGYTKMHSMGMAFISSALFEFTVEILTEPASVQDLYQTPVLGSILGLGIEHASMYLLNSESKFANILGHVINPVTLFPIYQGRSLIVPRFDDSDKGAMLKVEFRY